MLREILCTILILLNLLWFVLWPRIWSILVNVLYMHLKRMCILLLLTRVFCKCQLVPISLCYFFYILDDLLFTVHYWERSFEVFYILSIFSSISFCFMCFETLSDAYTLMIVVYSWWIDPFIQWNDPLSW